VITYSGAHMRVRRERGLAGDYTCIDCGQQAAEWSYDGRDPNALIGTAQAEGKPFSTDPEHYVPRCKPCHLRYDNNPVTRQRGEQHHQSKLTDAQRRDVLASRFETRADKQALAERIGVSVSQINRILRQGRSECT
jgi:hypothetical protein